VSSNLNLDYAILEEMSKTKEPLGAVNLALTVGERHNVSQATIGRRLLYLDHQGYIEKHKNLGRVLTNKGKEYFSNLSETLLFENAKDEFLKCLDTSNLNTLIDVLIARRGLEKEAAFLAAERAQKGHIEKMERALSDQKTKLLKQAVVNKEDKIFHTLIAEASGNIILQKAISLLREQNYLTQRFASVREITGGQLYHDHVYILEKIKNRDSEGAARSIETHINKMIMEIENFLNK